MLAARNEVGVVIKVGLKMLKLERRRNLKNSGRRMRKYSVGKTYENKKLDQVIQS